MSKPIIRSALFTIVGIVIGLMLGGSFQASPVAAQSSGNLLRVSVLNPDGATLHVALAPQISPNSVEIFYGSNVVIYNSTNIIATQTPGPYATVTPYQTPTQIVITPTQTSTATPAAIFTATVRRFPRLLVYARSDGGGGQVGAVGYGQVLSIVEEHNWWGRIMSPAGWIDMTYCDVR